MKTAWLLETLVVPNGHTGTRIAYFKGKHLHSGLPEYTFDANEALQFDSKESAEAHPKSPYHEYTATEHAWPDTPANA